MNPRLELALHLPPTPPSLLFTLGRRYSYVYDLQTLLFVALAQQFLILPHQLSYPSTPPITLNSAPSTRGSVPFTWCTRPGPPMVAKAPAATPSVEDDASSHETGLLSTLGICWDIESKEMAVAEQPPPPPPPVLLAGPPELSKYNDDFCLPLFLNFEAFENFCWWLLLLFPPPAAPPAPPPPPQILAPGRTFL